ncbi:hypothetical protein [Rhizobium sp. NRK18]|uniref:hypothetical protein n=1 Tax=Rhizobium sp. NRK18 TaxID=2964667 RepID=UPI0021C3C3CD|nr:hypothetical protein [Rhizobium sp. NRK18]MCQ2002864.1 hypothetical protein [Rhizobium sp. NRK18]
MINAESPAHVVICIIFFALSLTGCTSGGRIPEGYDQSSLVSANYRGSKIEISKGDGLPCSKTIQKSALGKYSIVDVGPDFLIVSSDENKKVLVPLADICFSMSG